MKILSTLFLLIILTACQEKEIEKVLSDDKLKNDSEAVAEDLIDLGEQLLRDELHLPEKKNEKNN